MTDARRPAGAHRPGGGARSRGAADPYALKRERMVAALAGRGVQDERVLQAIGAVPRHLFVDEGLRPKAYSDFALPIGAGQTISQPFTVARMTELLAAGPGHRVLELGTGSGYQTAVLARLARHVYSVERLRSLAERARRHLRLAGAVNVSLKLDDGTLGWEDRSPFDRILVTAGGPDVPEALLRQLGPGGRLVIPVGGAHEQRLVVVDRDVRGQLTRSEQGNCSFVRLVGRQGWAR